MLTRSIRVMICSTSWSCRRSSPCLNIATYSLLSSVRNVKRQGISALCKSCHLFISTSALKLKSSTITATYSDWHRCLTNLWHTGALYISAVFPRFKCKWPALPSKTFKRPTITQPQQHDQITLSSNRYKTESITCSGISSNTAALATNPMTNFVTPKTKWNC